MKPLPLGANQLHRFYRGGPAIAALRGIESRDDHAPEDWVGATTAAFGTDHEGMSRLPGGGLLCDAIRAAPEAFLGLDHVARWGPDPALLVKLLDAGERLPVHVHPGREFARRRLRSTHGKTEAWVIIGAQPDARVHVGFRERVDLETVSSWVRGQDAPAMLAALHELPVSAGDTVFVPAGTPHAIGEGVLMVELQEPTDFSILLEIPPGDGIVPDLGLGWSVALEAVDREALSERQLRSRLSARRQARSGVSSLLPDDAEPYFRAERIAPDPVAELDRGYSILVVVEGHGQLEFETGRWELRRGETLLIPHSAGPARVQGQLAAVRCRPADPARALEARW
jgi:mannose-6-phosphate isomerase